MTNGVIAKYIWLADTIMRHKFITRKEIDRLWILNTDLSEGNSMPRRTFHNYLRGIESTFNITILCNPSTFEYYIEESDEVNDDFRAWLLDSVAISGSLSDSRKVANRIMFENIPSAHEYLSIILEGVKENRRIEFEYKAFDRSGSSKVVLEPYFLRIFKQRWYVIGNEPKKNDIRTYSLDRFKSVRLLQETFGEPTLDVKEYFKDCFGIYRDKSTVKEITIKATSEQARYLRALPLHASQHEDLHDTYSIFHYRMLITYDFIQEILAMGDKVEVISPQTLRIQIIETLKNALSRYEM